MAAFRVRNDYVAPVERCSTNGPAVATLVASGTGICAVPNTILAMAELNGLTSGIGNWSIVRVGVDDFSGWLTVGARQARILHCSIGWPWNIR